jgi:hypothetical protein
MGPLGESLAAWLLFPAVAYLLFVGVALLLERATRVELPSPLLAPVGLVATVVIAMPIYATGAGAWLATPVAALVAAAGYALARGELRARLNPGWLGLAGLGAYVLYVAPVVASGGWTWTGYNFVNDTGVQFLLADHLAHDGTSAPPGPPERDPQSTGFEQIRIYLETGYPLGTHSLLATLKPLAAAPLEALYQPMIGLFAAAAAVSLGWLLALVSPLWLAVVGGFVAAAGNLAYQYGLQGSIKEMAMLAAVAVTAAVTRHVLGRRGRWGPGVVVGLMLAACILIYSTAALPYVAALAAGATIAAFVQRGRAIGRADLVRGAAVAAGVAAVASLPMLTKVVEFGETAENTFSGDEPGAADDLGHLLRPLRLVQAAGVWLGRDYRVEVPANHGLNELFIWFVIAVAAVGIAYLAARRESGLLVYFGAAGAALALVASRVSPYADGKLLMLLTPAVLAVAWAAIGAVGRRSALAAAPAAVVVSAAVLWSDALAYHGTQLAPIERLEALEDVGERYAGRGLMLVNDFEQFAQYFMRDARPNVALELITPYQAKDVLREGFVNLNVDVDQEPPEYLQYFPWIVERKGADTSRPPANYTLDYENRYYTVWRRDPAVTVRDHMPFQDLYVGAARPPCRTLRDFAATAQPGERLVAAFRPIGVRLDTLNAERSPAWVPHPFLADMVVPEGPGFARARARFGGGRYRVWVAGSFGRDVRVLVDGREVARVRGVNTEGEWLGGEVVRVAPGRHEIELRRGGGRPAPGDGFARALGQLVFEPLYPTDSIEWLAPAEVGRLCGRELDWVAIARRARG